MNVKNLHRKRAVCAVLFVLLLSVAGMTKVYASYDFSAVCSTGQTLYYNIIDATNHHVELTCPGLANYWSCWSGYDKPSGNIVFPNTVHFDGTTYSVTTIGDYAFYGCSNLSGSLIIPNSVTSIGEYAFYNCSGFTEVHYNASNCENANRIYPPFFGCSGTLTIGNNVDRIPAYMFSNAGFSGSLTIPNSMTSIGESAFKNCSGFAEVHYNASNCEDSDSWNPPFDGCSGTLTIGNNVERIPANMFSDAGFSGSLTIPNSVTTIGNSAFSGCSGFTGSLVIPNSVTSIGNSAFSGCSGFTGTLTIPNTVTSIGASVFSGCSGFTGSLTIPNSVTSIGNYAFSYCSGFTGTLTIPSSVTSISLFGAFYNCSGFTELHYNATNCADNSALSLNSTFEGCNCTLIIGDNVERIPACMFGYADFSGSLTIPNSVTSIGSRAFYGCSGFTGSLTIGNSVTSIGYYAFEDCSGFTGSLTIGNSVTSIGGSAFSGCSGFGSLTIPDVVTSIYDYAFSDCSGLASITVLANNPTVLGSNVFNNVDKTIPVYVPCASILTYQNTTGWNEFSNYLPETACDPGEIAVTVNPTEGGSIAGAGYHEGGAICTVIATAHDGYAFLYWKDGGTIVSWDTAYSFIVSGDRDLEAVFAEGEVCNMVFDLYDSYGDGWTGNYLVVDYGNGSSEQLTLRSGSSVSYSRPVQTGSLVTLTWIEGTGLGGCSFDISFENGVPIYHGANLNSSFQYEFVLDCAAAYATYTISSFATPEEGGTTEGAGEYDAGETCTLTAMPNRGYRFTEWTENGTQVSTETSYSFVVNRDRNLEAVFSEMIQPLLELEVDAEYYPDSLDSNSPYVNVHWGCSLLDCEIVEDFETGDGSTFGWQTDTTYPWAITTYDPYEGNYCVKSGGAGVGSVTSDMTVKVYVPADGVMSFFGKISSENQWDYGYFYIDGVQKGYYTGDGSWAERTFDITAGDHTFKWRYQKDSSVNMGDDCFYVDNITFYKQPEPPVQGVTYNFDDSSMQGWTSIDADGDGYGWMLSSDVMDTGYGYNGSTECVLSMSYNNDVGVLYPDNYLVSPQIQLGGVLKFYACAQDAGYSAEHFGVAVSMTNTNPSSFTMLNEWTMSAKSAGEPNGKPVKGNRGSRAQGNWYEYTVDLSAYSGMGFVAIRHFNCSDMFYLDIDDITIGEPVVPHSFDKYSVYRANCDGSEMQLIAGDVTGNQYIDTEWSEMAQGHYKYGVSIGDSPNADIFWSNCIEKQGDVAVQTTALSKGWNWYSTYIEQEGIDGLGQLENSIGVPNAIIQSQGDGYVKSILRNGRILWGGALSSINNEEMYKIGTKYICSATMEGNVTTPAEHPITINRGWNWIGFPCSQSVSINVAMSGFTPKNGDVIKGIHSYATFSNGTWSGTLNTLEPGQGYMYGSRSSRPKTLVFQTGRGDATIANITPENNFFQPTDDYADNMTLTAVVELDGEELRSDDYEIAAFVGDECRGSVKLMYVESIDRYVAFLTVFGDQEEDLHFRLTDGVASSLSTDRLAYTTDGILGTLDSPAVLHFGPMDVEENASSDVKVYPNPSEGIFNIEGQNIRKVEVFNAFGQLLYANEAENGLMMIDLTSQAAGIYLIRVVTDNGIWNHQVMKR